MGMNRWISIEEKWPELEKDVLIYTQYGEYRVACLVFDDNPIDGGYGFEGAGLSDYTELEFVLAWMPLPKPYEPQESEDHREVEDGNDRTNN